MYVFESMEEKNYGRRIKETREEFEKELEASLEKAETNESATWAHLEQMKEDETILPLTVGGVVKGGVIVYVEGIRGFIPASYCLQVMWKIKCMASERC